MVYALLEGVVVNYVVPDSLPSSTYSHNADLMRCRVRLHFMCLCNFWVFIRTQIPYKYTGEGSGCDTEYVWGTCEIVGCLLLHKYTYDGSGCETQYVCGTCENLIPEYLSDYITLTQAERIKVVTYTNIIVNSSDFWVPIPTQIHI